MGEWTAACPHLVFGEAEAAQRRQPRDGVGEGLGAAIGDAVLRKLQALELRGLWQVHGELSCALVAELEAGELQLTVGVAPVADLRELHVSVEDGANGVVDCDIVVRDMAAAVFLLLGMFATFSVTMSVSTCKGSSEAA